MQYLDDPGIELADNRAEYALWPAVVARKSSRRSKNTRHAAAFSAFTSEFGTLARNLDHSLVEAPRQRFTDDPGLELPYVFVLTQSPKW